MKCLCKSLFTLSFIFFMTIIGLRIYTYKNLSSSAAIIDQFNPLVKTEKVYTKTTQTFDHKYPDAVTKIDNFAYVQTCYTSDGQKRKLAYISFGKKLKANKILELTVKGQKVRNWQEINVQDVPKRVLPLL